jgi:hypothetical protein
MHAIQDCLRIFEVLKRIEGNNQIGLSVGRGRTESASIPQAGVTSISSGGFQALRVDVHANDETSAGFRQFNRLKSIPTPEVDDDLIPNRRQQLFAKKNLQLASAIVNSSLGDWYRGGYGFEELGL